MSIYDLVLLHVCHLHHHPQTFPQIRLYYRDTRAYILDLTSTNFVYKNYLLKMKIVYTKVCILAKPIELLGRGSNATTLVGSST